MNCSECNKKVKRERWEVKNKGVKIIYCYDCFSNEYGDYLHNTVLVDRYAKNNNNKQMKLTFYELDLKFKKYYIGG